MFRAIISPIFRSTILCLQFVVYIYIYIYMTFKCLNSKQTTFIEALRIGVCRGLGVLDTQSELVQSYGSSKYIKSAALLEKTVVA